MMIDINVLCLEIGKLSSIWVNPILSLADVARTTPAKDRRVNPGVMEMPRGKWDAIKITGTPRLRPTGMYVSPFLQLLK